jgi:hypothetical protein
MKLKLILFVYLIILIYIYIYINKSIGKEHFENGTPAPIINDVQNVVDITFGKTSESQISGNDFTQYEPEKLREFYLKDGKSIVNAIPNAKYYIDLINILRTTNIGRELQQDRNIIMNVNFNPPTNGYYWIDLPVVGPKYIYCIMDPAYFGGGWMLAMRSVKNSKTFRYRSPHWTTNQTLKSTKKEIDAHINNINPSDLNISSIGNKIYETNTDLDAKFDTFNYFKAKEWMAIFYPVDRNGRKLTGGGDFKENSRGWIWYENKLNYNGNYYSPMELFQVLDNPKGNGRAFNRNIDLRPSGVRADQLAKFRVDGKTQIWSGQAGFNFYGINYEYERHFEWRGNSVRWGFSWNNEWDADTTDVYAGIGLDYQNRTGRWQDDHGGFTWNGYDNGRGFSCGDFIWCCQNTTGLNDSMAFEWYVR